MSIQLIMIAYRKIPQLFWLGIFITFCSCAEDDTYEWTWGDSRVTENQSVADAGFNLGCAILRDIIECTPNCITFSCGYRIDELPHEAKHYDGKEHVADGPLDDFEITGVVLLALATQEQEQHYLIGPEPEEVGSHFISDILRVAKTATEIENPKEVFFKNVSLVIDSPKCQKEVESWWDKVFSTLRCWGAVHPTFIICWDNSKTGVRAYQFVRPVLRRYPTSSSHEFHPGCDVLNYHPLYGDLPKPAQLLLVSWPLLDKYAKRMDMAPDPENWTDWIDEILPRP